MRLLLPLWLLASSLSFPLLADEVPDLAARIHYQDRVTSSDGISKESQWQEKWLRVGDQVWSQRLIPLPLARAYHAAHDATPGHKHFTHQMAARWVTRDQQGMLQLRYADSWHNQLVEVPEEEYGQVAFKPDWPRIRHLINPALLQEMTPLDETAPETRRAGMKDARATSAPASSGRLAGSCRWWWSRRASTAIAATGWR